MKIISEKIVKGTRRVWVELASDELLMSFRDGSYYKLAYPSREVYQGRHLIESTPVEWCVVSQEWVE